MKKKGVAIISGEKLDVERRLNLLVSDITFDILGMKFSTTFESRTGLSGVINGTRYSVLVLFSEEIAD